MFVFASASAKTWTGGVVTDPQQAEDESVPRTISMARGDVCDTEVGCKYIKIAV